MKPQLTAGSWESLEIACKDESTALIVAIELVFCLAADTRYLYLLGMFISFFDANLQRYINLFGQLERKKSISII